MISAADGAVFHARMTANKGRGYVSATENKAKAEDMPIGVLPIDSIYTPIERVNYQVEKLCVSSFSTMISASLASSVKSTNNVKCSVKILADIILNLKKVALKLDSEDSQTLEFDVVGPKEVTAGDIQGSSDVEILNPDQLIAVTSSKTPFTVENSCNTPSI